MQKQEFNLIEQAVVLFFGALISIGLLLMGLSGFFPLTF